MKIKINDKDKIIDSGSLTVKELLKIAEVENPEMVSVQLNGEFVYRDAMDKTHVKDGDAIDFLYFMGGGAEGGI